MLHLRPGDYAAMPWKDGGGVTEQIAIEPPGATLSEPFLWRLSMARVERSGPFSRFPGCDRTLLLLEGSELEVDFGPRGRARLARPFEPLAFSGDWEARGELRAGPVRDFNIISDRSRVKQRVEVLEPGAAPIRISAHWLFGLEGAVEVAPSGIRLAPREALKLDGAEVELRAELSARLLAVRFESLVFKSSTALA